MPAMWAAQKMHKHQARAGGNQNRAEETFPRFAGADARDHLVPANERADDIRAMSLNFVSKMK